MEGAEKLRLIQLAKQFSQYKDELQQIWERMVDLSLPFSSGEYLRSTYGRDVFIKKTGSNFF